MLQKNLLGAIIVYVDICENLLHLIQHQSDYGKFIITIKYTSLCSKFYTTIFYRKIFQVLRSQRKRIVGLGSWKLGLYVMENQLYVPKIPSKCFGIVFTLQRRHMGFLWMKLFKRLAPFYYEFDIVSELILKIVGISATTENSSTRE